MRRAGQGQRKASTEEYDWLLLLCVRSTAQQGGRLSQRYNTLQCAAVMHESDADLNQKQHLMHNVAGSITFAKMSPDSRLSHVLIVNLLSSEERAGPQRQTCRFWCSLANAS